MGQEIVPGLVRWTGEHPDWTAGDDWDRSVGCLLYELEDSVVLFDPLIPSDRRAEFLSWLDSRVASRPTSILTTIRWHARDRRELAERYEANSSRAWNVVPAGVEPKPMRGAGEILYWLPKVATLVSGDRLIGEPGNGLTLCPEDWLEDERVDRAGLARLLEPLLDLPIVRILPSHGDPVLHGGQAALSRAIEEALETERRPLR